jgi:hypothetical protein
MKKTIVAAVIASISFALPASAIEVEQMGNCSKGSQWNADLELEFRVFDLSFDIDTRDANQDWTLTLRHNGKKALTQTVQSMQDFDDSYAEVEWNMIRPDRRGADTFNFRAVNKVTGEVCRATLKA